MRNFTRFQAPYIIARYVGAKVREAAEEDADVPMRQRYQ